MFSFLSRDLLLNRSCSYALCSVSLAAKARVGSDFERLRFSSSSSSSFDDLNITLNELTNNLNRLLKTGAPRANIILIENSARARNAGERYAKHEILRREMRNKGPTEQTSRVAETKNGNERGREPYDNVRRRVRVRD